MASGEGRASERGAIASLAPVPKPFANLVTILRIMAIPPAGWFVLHGNVPWAFTLISFAALSDALDGWLARRYGTTTLGSWLDAAADRLLIAVVLGSLWWSGGLPLWIVVVLIGREAAVALGALVLGRPDRPLSPLVIGKVHTAAAFTLLVVAVAVAGGWLPATAVDLMGALVLATALVSLAAYVQRRRAARTAP